MASFEINDSDLTGFQGKVAVITGRHPSTQSDCYIDPLTSMQVGRQELVSRPSNYWALWAH